MLRKDTGKLTHFCEHSAFTSTVSFRSTACALDPSLSALFTELANAVAALTERQLMNAFGVIFRYLQLKKMSPADRKRLVPRLSVFAGKAAPGYHIAKLIIKLINSISKTINADEEIREYLSVAFLPDYAVSLAQILVPASDIHEHISTAGTEVSRHGHLLTEMISCSD